MGKTHYFEGEPSEFKKDAVDAIILATGARPIWRYMDYWKFKYLLERSAIYFSRVDLLEDQFEGDIPLLNAGDSYSPEFFQLVRQGTFVSCWHWNAYENSLMWRAYTSFPRENTIAVYCDLLHLHHALPREIPLVPISYIDQSVDKFHVGEENIWAWMFRSGGLRTPYFHKRREFEGEVELRAILQDFGLKNGHIEAHPANGIDVRCNLNTLLNRIVLSPNSPKEFHREVRNLLDWHNLKAVPILLSALDKPPNPQQQNPTS